MATSSKTDNPRFEINAGGAVDALAFAPNGEYLVSGNGGKVRLWRVEDGEQITTMEAESVRNNLGSGAPLGREDAQEILDRYSVGDSEVCGVHFSPDSNKLVVTADNNIAKVFNISTQGAYLFYHKNFARARAVKYSPKGDRIAIATAECLQVWNSNDARSPLVEINVGVTPRFNNSGLLWFDDHLFVVSGNKIKRIDAATGSVVSEWRVPDGNDHSCIALVQNGEFIAYSTNRTVTFWHTSTCTQMCLMQYPTNIKSISFSPDDQSIAIGQEDGKVTIKNLSTIAVSYALSRLHPSFQEPDGRVIDVVVYSSKHDQLADAEASLTSPADTSGQADCLVLACRAFVRTRLQYWDGAIIDAEQSIKIQPTVLGYVAKSVALLGNGERHKAYRACDIAFEYLHSTPVTFLLLIKAVVVFMAGEHDDAMSRVDDLIAIVRDNSVCYVVQAYMHFLIGNLRMENNDHDGAIRSFQRARARLRNYAGYYLITISLISGWEFDDLEITITQRLCEALHASHRMEQAAESLLEMVNAIKKVNMMSNPINEWVSDFTRRCLSSDNDGNSTPTTGRHPELQAFDATISSAKPLLTLWITTTLVRRSWEDALATAKNFTLPKFMVYRALCDHLLKLDRITDAVECLKESSHGFTGMMDLDGEATKWIEEFRETCSEKLARLGDEAMDHWRRDDAISQYSTALSLSPVIAKDILIKRGKAFVIKGLWADALHDANQVMVLDPLSTWNYESVLLEWARQILTNGSWRNAISSTESFDIPRFAIYQALCKRLDMNDFAMDASECFNAMENELPLEERQGIRATWISEFRDRCHKKLEKLADTATRNKQYDDAITKYSAALSLKPISQLTLFLKRSQARAAKCLWKYALDDANEAIRLDPSSPWGYERKYAALRGAGLYAEMQDTFEMILSKMSQSNDPSVHARWDLCTQTKEAIRRAILEAIRESPRVLLNTTTGRLCDKSQQAAAFELSPAFADLLISMMTHIDHGRIDQAVKEYYRYATFSHKWEEHEPLYDRVIHVVVYDLDESLTHTKLQMFCKIVRDAGFNWAWSDTCCINKADHFVLQEALVSMFKWYEGSSLTVIYLRGVRSPSRRGDLVKSVWNMRAWTFQEYHASKVVRIYTEDWKPYLDLDIPNHKESPEIIAEMEEATGISALALKALRPGLDDIRQKLCLASQRQTTLVEDAAYSLLGIFSISLPVVYGEGDKALGRLLAQLLASSGDTSILAWTGKSGSFNSCLPSKITVFRDLSTTHIPPAINGSQMDMTTARLQTASLDLSLVIQLYDRLLDLPVPSFAGRRMKLPCITFKLGPLSGSRIGSDGIYRAQTTVLGAVEIVTNENLSQLDSLYLVHPWIDFLLDRQPIGGVMETAGTEDFKGVNDGSALIGGVPLLSSPSNVTPPFGPSLEELLRADSLGMSIVTSRNTVLSLLPPSTLSPVDKQMRAIQMIARLKQPFGALLLTPNPGGVAAYRRVAAESTVTVQVQKVTPTISAVCINNGSGAVFVFG